MDRNDIHQLVYGQQLDPEFLSTLVLPAGMRVLLWRDLGGSDLPGLGPLIERVKLTKHEATATIGSGANAGHSKAMLMRLDAISMAPAETGPTPQLRLSFSKGRNSRSMKLRTLISTWLKSSGLTR